MRKKDNTALRLAIFLSLYEFKFSIDAFFGGQYVDVMTKFGP